MGLENGRRRAGEEQGKSRRRKKITRHCIISFSVNTVLSSAAGIFHAYLLAVSSFSSETLLPCRGVPPGSTVVHQKGNFKNRDICHTEKAMACTGRRTRRTALTGIYKQAVVQRFQPASMLRQDRVSLVCFLFSIASFLLVLLLLHHHQWHIHHIARNERCLLLHRSQKSWPHTPASACSANKA